MSRAILYDSTKCIGCRLCEAACAERWGLPYDEKVAAEEQLSAHKLTVIQTHGDHFDRRSCMHCLEPTCVAVCPVGAMKKTALGPVVYDESRCIGCRYCMLACPFQVPSYEWSQPLPRVRKCDMCYERQLAGQLPACVEACPTGATLCGERDDLIAEAERRVAENSDQYHGLYGVMQAGGTSLLFVTAVPYEKLCLQRLLPPQPLSVLTWRMLARVPDIVVVGALLLGGIWWITRRRSEVAAAEALEEEP